ncbi:AAA family ATPase [Spirosoma horti]
MRLIKLSLKNFRGYSQKVIIPIHEKLTGITGKNDVGKSTILEALDLFFEGGEISLDKDDFNVQYPDLEIEISCIFDDIPGQVIIDEANNTSLAGEYLLNANGEFELIKKFKRSALNKPQVFILANHPSCENYLDLHSLKISELKKRSSDVGMDKGLVDDERKSSDWRKALWSNCPSLKLKETELEISKFAGDSKSIQEKITSLLPMFALFRGDRESKDSDPHAKNPLQEAVKHAQNELKDQIQLIQEQIQQRVLERAQNTIEKLKEMDSSLASYLNPRFKSPPKWTFDFSIDDEDNIPINKRGSGVRRLILLNFFRAEAERRLDKSDSQRVIYAFEEPETSQHPKYQEMLVKALLQISDKPNCQVILTTHVPALAGLLPIDGLVLVEKINSVPNALFGTDDVFEKISNALGVFPDTLNIVKAKALILLEGHSDVTFIGHMCQKLKEGGYITNTLEEAKILPLVIGGCGNLKHWKAKKLAEQFGLPWAVLLDSDKGTQEEGQNLIKINELIQEGKKGFLTRKREPENYLHPEILGIEEIKAFFSDTDDVKVIINSHLRIAKDDVLEKCWKKMEVRHIREAECYIDEDGVERYEFTEMISELLQMVN